MLFRPSTPTRKSKWSAVATTATPAETAPRLRARGSSHAAFARSRELGCHRAGFDALADPLEHRVLHDGVADAEEPAREACADRVGLGVEVGPHADVYARLDGRLAVQRERPAAGDARRERIAIAELVAGERPAVREQHQRALGVEAAHAPQAEAFAGARAVGDHVTNREAL